MRDKFSLYDELIAALQTFHQTQPDKGYARKALEIFERKQSRVFLAEMGQSGTRLFAGIPEEILQRDKTLEYQIATVRENRANAITQGKNIKQLDQHLARLQTEQQNFEHWLTTNYPDYYALKYPKPTVLAELQQTILQAGEFMLVYNVMANHTALWVIGKQTFQFLVLDISEIDLNAKVAAFLPHPLNEAIEEQSPSLNEIAKETLTGMHQTGYELFKQLLPEPAHALLKEVSTLYIIPTGSLYGLPFGALNMNEPAHREKPHYLIEDYPLAYLSSASLLKILRDTKRKTTQRYPLLAFADPKYPETCQTSVTTCFTQQDELPNTKKEAQAIAKLLKVPGDSEALQLHDNASRQKVFEFNQQQRLDDYQYVLFAAHAVLPEEISDIGQPAIVLSYSAQEPPAAGYLTMSDIFGLQMNADLVVLSAGETGRGEMIKGEGVMGLNRAFMYAGARAVSVNLWAVNALANRYLNVNLFKYLKQGKPLAEALRQSQLDFLRNPKYVLLFQKHPFFWASRIVFGEAF